MFSDRLRSAPLFEGLTDSQRQRVAELMTEREVDMGAVVARRGEFAYHLFLVAEGSAVVAVDGEQVTTLGPGDAFGEIGVIERGRRTADVVATSPMRLLTMTVWEFNELAEEMPEFAAHARATAQERLERAGHVDETDR